MEKTNGRQILLIIYVLTTSNVSTKTPLMCVANCLLKNVKTDTTNNNNNNTYIFAKLRN